MADSKLENHHYDSSEDHSVDVNDDFEPTPDVVTTSDADASSATEPTEATTADGDATRDDDSSGSSLAKTLSSLMSCVIRDFDSRAEQTLQSQDQLSFAIDRLTRELDQLLEDAPLPFIMQHAVKISGVRKRVVSLNLVLKTIQRRVDNIDRLLSAGLRQDKMGGEDDGDH